MVPPFAADNEDEVLAAVFNPATTTSAFNADEGADEDADDVSAQDDGPHIQDEPDDERTPREKILDFDAVPSDDDDNAPKSSSLNKGSAKRAQIAIPGKKKEKPADLIELLSAISKEKAARAAARTELAAEVQMKKLDLQQKTLDLEAKKHEDSHQLQFREMQLREREMQIREQEMKLRQKEMETRQIELEAIIMQKKSSD